MEYKTKNIKRGVTTIKRTIQKKLEDLDNFMRTPEFTKLMDDAWGRYKGQLSRAEWEIKYKTLYKNREIGKLTEEQFQLLKGGYKPSKGISTSDGTRYFDNVLDGTAREVKSGPVTLI